MPTRRRKSRSSSRSRSARPRKSASRSRSAHKSASRSRSVRKSASRSRSVRKSAGTSNSYVVTDNGDDRFRVTTRNGRVTVVMLPIKSGQREQTIVDDMPFVQLKRAKDQNATAISFVMDGPFLYLSDRAIYCNIPGPVRFESIVGNSGLNYSWAVKRDSLYMLTARPPTRIDKAGFVASGLKDPYDYLYGQKPTEHPFEHSVLAEIRRDKMIAKKLKPSDV